MGNAWGCFKKKIKKKSSESRKASKTNQAGSLNMTQSQQSSSQSNGAASCTDMPQMATFSGSNEARKLAESTSRCTAVPEQHSLTKINLLHGEGSGSRPCVRSSSRPVKTNHETSDEESIELRLTFQSSVMVHQKLDEETGERLSASQLKYHQISVEETVFTETSTFHPHVSDEETGEKVSPSLSQHPKAFNENDVATSTERQEFCDRSIPSDNYFATFQMLVETIQDQVSKLKSESLKDDLTKQVFSSNVVNCCRAYIINNKIFDVLPERVGTDEDQKALEEMFKSIDFEILVDKDLSAVEMEYKIRGFIAKCQSEPTLIIVIVVLTHGGEGDILFGKDGKRNDCGAPVDNTFIKRIEKEEILTEIEDKPKILIIQACRVNKDYQLNYCDERPEKVMPSKRNLFVINMTSPDCLSYRSTVTGSFCLQEFTKTVRDKAKSEDLLSIFHTVEQVFQAKKLPNGKSQCPEMTFCSDRKLYLQPKGEKQNEEEESELGDRSFTRKQLLQT